MATAEDVRRERRLRGVDIVLGLVATLAVLAALAYVMLGGRSLDPLFIWETPLPILFDAARLAIVLTTMAYTLGMGIGFFVGWARTLQAPPLRELLKDLPLIRVLPIAAFAGIKAGLRRMADFYVEVVRGTPLIIQIAFFFTLALVFTPAGWGIVTKALFAGTVALLVNTGGYQGEIFRGGFQAVESGQVEAARAIGLGRWGRMRHVVLPQALRLIIPPLTNEYIALYKASSLLFVIGVREITWWGTRLTRQYSANLFEIFIVIIAVYLVVTIPLSRVIGVLERRFRIPGLGLEAAPREALTLGALRKDMA